MGIIVSNDEIIYTGTPKDLKKSISKKFLERKNKSATQIAKENGVTVKTLYNWAEKYATNHPMRKRNPNTLQKMKLLITYDALAEKDKGEFLRKEGLHSEQLEQWRLAVLENSLDNLGEKNLQVALEEKNKEVKSLKKELKRKDKALAESAALLLLKKKMEDYFQEEEDEE